MILVDNQIREGVETGKIGIENFSYESLQPASYDLRIGPLIYTPLSETPDKPIDLSTNGGFFRLPPYGNVILMTYETLILPKNMIGRFGLKSGFARRGLFASTGPQVDPGYKGKLFISLLNLVPRSHILNYKETFLTIEFHTLEKEPDKSYEGPYQSMEDINSEILEDLVRLEGLNLAQVQSQFSELTQHIEQWSVLASRFDDFLTEMKSHTKALVDLTNRLGSSAQSAGQPKEPVYAREISLEDAVQEISELFKKNPEMYYSDIAEELCLDYGIVMEACQQLQKKGIIEEVPHGQKSAKKTG